MAPPLVAAPAAVGILGRSLGCALHCTLPGLPVCMIRCRREFADKCWGEQVHIRAKAGCAANRRCPHCCTHLPRRLQSLGITPRTKDAAPAGGRFPYVLFAAPPSGSEDYVGEIKAALALWDGTGAFVFTSSAGVYTVEDGSGGWLGGWLGGCWRLPHRWPAVSYRVAQRSQHSVLGVLHCRSRPASPTQSTSRLPRSL